MGGESIGSMIDSELENLSVDRNFEKMRQQLEVPSEYKSYESEPEPDLQSVEEFENERYDLL